MFRLAREAADGAEAEPFTGGSVVARHEIDYLRPLVHRHEPVTIELWVTKLNAASATLGYEIKDETTHYVRAATVIVPFDLEQQRPRRLSPAEKLFLERYLDDAVTARSGRAPAPAGPAGAARPG
jgi:acyl-CoA thioester hydrolase